MSAKFAMFPATVSRWIRSGLMSASVGTFGLSPNAPIASPINAPATANLVLSIADLRLPHGKRRLVFLSVTQVAAHSKIAYLVNTSKAIRVLVVDCDVHYSKLATAVIANRSGFCKNLLVEHLQRCLVNDLSLLAVGLA